MSELVCKHCQQACWLLEAPCDECDQLDKGAKEFASRISREDQDSSEAFFYRFLLLDDMKQRKKEEYDARPQASQASFLKDEERDDRRNFILRKSRPVTPVNSNTVESSCYRCGDLVYQAEARMTMGKTFHAICFTCRFCHRFLDAMNVTDGPDGDAYCYNCYKQRFLNAVNRPVGASKTNSILAKEGDDDRCPRCYGKVFQAERAMSSHGVYHLACFRCAEIECGKQLDSTSYCDSDTGKIFCRTCYNKVHGSHGFGYGTAPTLTCAPETIPPPPPRNISSESRDKSSSGFRSVSLPASPRCPKCSVAVYAPERVFVGRKVWHKGCLSCTTCSRMLDSSLLNEINDGESVYCPKCYKNTFKSSVHVKSHIIT